MKTETYVLFANEYRVERERENKKRKEKQNYREIKLILHFKKNAVGIEMDRWVRGKLS